MLVALLTSGAIAHAAADPEMFWFKNETECGGAKVAVRSYCEVSEHASAVNPRNAGCSEQQLVITRPGKPAITHDLLEHEPVGDDFHIASSLRCVAAGKEHYLLLTLSTGGSCDTCETQAIIGLDGRWKRYNGKWSAPSAEEHAIRRSEADWKKTPAFDLPNTVREK